MVSRAIGFLVGLFLAAAPARAAPALDGTFLDGSTLPESAIPAFMREIRSLGMDTVIVFASRTKPQGCAGSAYHWLPGFPQKLGDILREAQANGIKVYAGLALTMWPCNTFYINPNADLTIKDTESALEELARSRYAGHPALAGWYIPDEPALAGWTHPELTYRYYAGLVGAIRARSSKPILVAPYLIGARSARAVAAAAAKFRDATGIDVQVWQDSVGAAAINLGWRQGDTLDQYYVELGKVLGKGGLWSDNELFNCCTDTMLGGAYRPASIYRINLQLWETPLSHVGKRVVWLQQLHMGSLDPARHPESGRALAAFKSIYGLDARVRRVRPADYFWGPPPAPEYSDTSNKLFNLRTGDPKNFADREWVGVLGTAEVVLRFQPAQKVDWIGAHVLNSSRESVGFPDSMAVACSQDGRTWSTNATVALPVPKADSEYVFSNPSPLGLTCPWLRLTFANSVWTFLSELELFSDSSALPGG